MTTTTTTSLSSLIDEYTAYVTSRYDVVFLSKTFANLPPHKRVSLVYHMMKTDGVLPTIEKTSSKSADKAVEYRNLGNKAFCNKRDTQALEYYTKSVAYAPNNSQELALAYANRSAVLFRLSHYKPSVLDISRALRGNYPESLKQKLYDRKTRCLESMNALEDLWGITEYLNQERMCDELKYAMQPRLFQLPDVDFENVSIPNASKKIKINFDASMGRHLVATKNIKPGEVLAIEKPYASVLLPNRYYTHCSNCYMRDLALIPCNDCPYAMFCCEFCRDSATNNFHRMECQILPTLRAINADKFMLLTVRVLMVASKQGKDLKNLMDHPIYKDPIRKNYSNFQDKFVSEDYFSVHNLSDNFYQRTVADVFLKSIEVTVTLHTLKESSFFRALKTEKNDSTFLTEDESLVGTLLLKYLMITLCNAHEISELVEKNLCSNAEGSSEILEIGAALYPLLSLANHSCDPNVTRHNSNDQIVFRSCQPIRAGEQLFDNYGYHYAVHPKADRQKRLRQQYFFECHCIPCKVDWPLHSKLPYNKEPEYLSDSVDKTELRNISKMFKTCVKDKLTRNTHEEVSYDFLCDYLLLLHENIKRPWREYNECQEYLKQLMAYQGNCYVQFNNVII